MTIKEMCRDDLLGRFASHTFTETAVGGQTRVEFKDGGSAVVAGSTKLDVNDAYQNIRENVVGDFSVLFCLTTTEKDAVTSVLEGTQCVDITLNEVQTYQSGAWAGGSSTVETIALTANTTLLDSHSGKHLTVDNGSDVTLTLNTGLKAGFQCSVEQIGVGVAQVSANGTTINSLAGATKTSGVFAVAALVQTATDVYTFSGDIGS